MTDKVEFLKFNVSVLNWLNLWPNRTKYDRFRTLKDFSLIISIIPPFLTIFVDLVIQLSGRLDDIADLTENLVALAAIIGTFYIVTCFARNREKVRVLIAKLYEFYDLSDKEEMLKTDKLVAIYSKVFLVYGILGILAYCVIPLMQRDQCEQKRARSTYSKNITCKLVTRCVLPPGFNETPYIQFMFVHQVYTCVVLTLITLTITVLLCGILMHTVTQIKQLRLMLTEACKETNDILSRRRKVNYCVKYHIMIIDYAADIKDAFSSMMLMHLTLTSFLISVLLYEILSVTTLSDSFRFGMHLFGWISMLLLTCYYGQTLIDESSLIGHDAYDTEWYYCDVPVQKTIMMIIMRAQKPLTLDAMSLGIISLETFLSVMSTAYSYFTLLVNMKN